jgi:hypothetical protein
MRHAMILLVALSLLVAWKQELTKDNIELYAAVAYVTWGMEEGNNKFSAERVDRNMLPTQWSTLFSQRKMVPQECA